MDNDRQVYSYSWHQSHDQATVLLLVPYETLPEDVWVVIEQNYLVAGIRGQLPIIKGRLYGNVDVATSMWQLEPRPSMRGRTTSTASTMSTQSSYAYISDPEITSSFAASLESAHASDNEACDSDFASPDRSRPVSRDEPITQFSGTVPAFSHHQGLPSHPGSPRLPTSMTSSLSSIDSFQHGRSGRLLTLYLEKVEAIIWPSLIVGPVPESFSQIATGPFFVDIENERKYNMDATSLGLMGEEYLDIRHDKEKAFEHFVRAWHQAHTPLSTLRLVQHFLPMTAASPQSRTQSPRSLSPSLSTSSSSSSVSSSTRRSSYEHYLQCIGGPSGLAKLYIDAGLLHLEGRATNVMSSSYSALSSIRVSEPSRVASLRRSHHGGGGSSSSPNRDHTQEESGTDACARDYNVARRYFDRARQLDPTAVVPMMPLEHVGPSSPAPGSTSRQTVGGAHDLQMPSMDVNTHASFDEKEKESGTLVDEPETTVKVRRRRQQAASAAASESIFDQDDEDNTWYLYLPGLIGAGTALLVVGVVSALSFNTWRKNQN